MLEQAQAIKDKTSIIDNVNQIMSKSNSHIEFVGLAPTLKATSELNDKGIKSQTMQSFLADEVNFGRHPKDTAKNTNYENKVILLDEFSMASNKDILLFKELVNNNGAKAIYLGDVKQLNSLESGSPVELMMRKNSIQVTQMKDIKRQKTTPYLNAIKSLVNGDVKTAIDNISLQNATGTYYENEPSLVNTSEDRKEEIQSILKNENLENGGKRAAILNLALTQITDKYLSRPEEIRNKTLIVTNSHTDRDIMHDKIRSGLGLGADINIDRLRAKNLTNAEMRELEYEKEVTDKYGSSYIEKTPRYEKGMVFQQGNDKFSTIVDVDLKERSISLLDNETKKETKIYPGKMNHDFNTLYEVHKSALSPKDLLILKGDDKANNIRKNDRVQVTEIKDGIIYAKNDEKEVKLDTKNPQHMVMEYGYTNTTMSSQGMTIESVLPFVKSQSPLNSLKSLYVALSRGQIHTTLFTDNLDWMLKNIQSSSDKTMAHQVIEKISALSLEKLKLDPIEKDIQANDNKNPKAKTISNQLNLSGVLSQLPQEILKDPQYLDHNNKFNIKLYGNDIADDLVKYTESIAQQYLGEPNRKESNSHTMAFGKSGALKVTLTGEHRGKWKDWSDNNRSGDLITLIKDQRNISYTEAVIEASKIIGQPGNFSIKETQNSAQLVSENTVTKTKSYEYGQRIWQEAQPIKGTLAEKYLEHRGIKNTELTGLRYHHGVYTKESPTNYQPALVASFTDKDRNISAIEVIYLDRETGYKADGFHTGKKTYGSKNSAAIDLSPYNQDTNISLISEGAITGLSVKEAYPNEHILAVGGKENIANISPDILNEKVIICADNDGKDISQDSSLNQAIDVLKEAGKSVEIVAPDNILNQQKVDFNDTLTHQGVDDIKEKIDNIISKLDNDLDKQQLENHILSEININELAKDIDISEQHSIDNLVKECLNNDINIEELTKDIEENNIKIIDNDLEL